LITVSSRPWLEKGDSVGKVILTSKRNWFL
jgi:hypothetical protein